MLQDEGVQVLPDPLPCARDEALAYDEDADGTGPAPPATKS